MQVGISLKSDETKLYLQLIMKSYYMYWFKYTYRMEGNLYFSFVQQCSAWWSPWARASCMWWPACTASQVTLVPEFASSSSSNSSSPDSLFFWYDFCCLFPALCFYRIFVMIIASGNLIEPNETTTYLPLKDVLANEKILICFIFG